MKTEIQECHTKLEQITASLTVERTQKGKITGSKLEEFTELFDEHMQYLKQSAQAVGTTKYEDIAGLAREHLQNLEQVIGERDNLKAVIAKYEADKAAPNGGGDVNAALAVLKAAKLAVDGELVTVNAEVEALKTKYTSTRDELTMVQAHLANSQLQVSVDRRKINGLTAELDRYKTALVVETAKYQDLLKKAPTNPPPSSGARTGTARLKDRVTTLLEELQKLVPTLQGQPFVKRVESITELINQVFVDISSIHDKRQILTLIAQNLFPSGDQELRRDLDRLLVVHGV
jgi:hypothetical protein